MPELDPSWLEPVEAPNVPNPDLVDMRNGDLLPFFQRYAAFVARVLADRAAVRARVAKGEEVLDD